MFRQGNTVAYQRSQSFLKSLLLGLLLGAGIIFAVPSQASAISNNGPDPAELGGRAGERFGYTVATPGVGGGGTTVPIPIYYQDNAGTKTITITGGDLCNDPIESAPLTGGNDRDVSYDPAANAIGAIATQFYMRNEQQGTNHGEIFSHVTDVDTCFSDQLVLTFNATTALTYDARLNMFYGYLYASMSGAVVDAANRFNVVADSTAKIGFSARNSAETFGVSRLHPYSGENEFRLPFAPDCTLTTGVRRVQAVLYDLDNGDPDVQNSLNMQIYVEETTLENAGVRIPAQFTTTADPASAPVQSTGDPSGYTVTSGNNGTVYVQFDVVAGNKYILGVTNVHYKNGIQFQLPFDSIYADVTACDPPKDLACGTATVNPTDPEINEPLTVAATLRFNRQVTAVLTDPTLSVRLRNGTGAPLGVTVAQLGNTVTLTSDAYVATAPGLHTVQWAITINGERITCGGSFRSSDSFLVLSHPLLKVTGGDVATGSSFSTGSGTGLVPCDRAQHNPKAGIVSWNRGAPTFVGAGTQYAVFAMSYIQNFVTNQGNSQPPTSLSFSNVNYRPEAMNSVDPATGFFGGL